MRSLKSNSKYVSKSNWKIIAGTISLVAALMVFLWGNNLMRVSGMVGLGDDNGWNCFLYFAVSGAFVAISAAFFLAYCDILQRLHFAIFALMGACLGPFLMSIAVYNVRWGAVSGFGMMMFFIGGYVYLIMQGHIHDKDWDWGGDSDWDSDSDGDFD